MESLSREFGWYFVIVYGWVIECIVLLFRFVNLELIGDVNDCIWVGDVFWFYDVFMFLIYIESSWLGF